MKKELQNKIIYQVFTRNYTREGTFKALENHLKDIKELGTDIIYLLPISPTGEINRKGDLGSPYSIKDYMQIDPLQGDEKDLIHLINEIHKLNMKVMIDIVFNHTSYNSKLYQTHPEWFFKDNNNVIRSKCADWSDVIDLNYKNNDDLVSYLLNVLEYYVSLGIDGFRFDVVSMLGENFFIRFKDEFLARHPGIITLGESIDFSFLNYLRREYGIGLSDAELYTYGFNLLYPYNSFTPFKEYLDSNDITKLLEYKRILANEESCVPASALRIRCFENHDQNRICQYTTNPLKMRNLAAYSFFAKGPALIYNGLETNADHHLSLFTKDLLDLSIDNEWYNFIKTLISLKKDPLSNHIVSSETEVSTINALLIKNHLDSKEKIIGIFNLNEGSQTSTSSFLENGKYIDLISNKEIEIVNNTLTISEPLELKEL